MTSRNSFFKLMKEDLRQRLWTIVLACIAFLLPIPIALGMMISNYRPNDYYSLVRDLAYPLGGESAWLAIVTIVGAVICAVSGFGYLFSKKKVDFFHSLPVKREKLFAVRYVNGVLIYLVPYLVMILISFALIAVSGHFESLIFTSALEGLAVHVLGYLTVYTTLILCVTFVGNIVVFFAVSGWTFGITLVVLSLYTWFEEMFFYTYSYLGDSLEERLYSLRFLCPGYFYAYQIITPEVSMLFQQLVYTVVLLVIALLVYRVRPSDGAGKAIAFPILKPILRISIEILAGGCIGMLFFNMADNGTGVPGWMLFGVVLGVVLSHMLVESIFHYDIRKCFADKLSMVACVAVTIGFVLVMRYDVFGYDKYLPKEKKIESVAIEINGLDGYRNVYYYGDTGATYVEEIYEMELTNITAVYPYLESLVEDSEIYYKNRELLLATGDVSYKNSSHVSVNVAYRLKSGKTIYRNYMANGIREELFAPVFENEEYKRSHYADVYTLPIEDLGLVTPRYAMNEQIMNLTLPEREEFMAALQRELSAQTLKEKLNTLPVAIVTLSVVSRYQEYDYNGDVWTREYNQNHEIPIYASFTETLRFLVDRGFTAEAEYAWTGEERMWLELPNERLKEAESAEVYEVGVDYNDEVDYFLIGDEKIAVEQEIWNHDYGYGTVKVAPEDWEKLYEFCQWQDLYDYCGPTESVSEYYKVYLEVPLDGYNNYNTYRFYIDGDADLSFLFD